jgi:hypothetical protein
MATWFATEFVAPLYYRFAYEIPGYTITFFLGLGAACAALVDSPSASWVRVFCKIESSGIVRLKASDRVYGNNLKIGSEGRLFRLPIVQHA